MQRIYFVLSIFTAFVVLIASCTKDKGVVPSQGITSDDQLYAYMLSQTYSYYQSSVTPITSTSGPGAHNGTFFLKFNSKAAAALGGDGKLPVNGSFPDSSLIVKELYNGGASPYVYAVMMKSKSPFAKNGWLWAEYNPGGSVAYSIKKDGLICINCHTGGRDYLWSFDAHP